MEYFKIFKINDHIWQLKDPLGVLVTLVKGEKYALLVDTAYGIGDLNKAIRTITDLPLIVINSHGHMDHTGGNYQFDKVYISEIDIPLCKLHNSPNWRMNNLLSAKRLNLIGNDFCEDFYLKQNAGNLAILPKSKEFDLGGLGVKIVNLEGHTKGSIGVLIESDKILITTDAICPFVWLFLEESTTVTTYIKMLERTFMLPFDKILLGHGAGTTLDRSRVDEFLKVAKEIDLKKSVKVTFNNFENLNSYCYTPYKMYDQSGAGIVFDPDKL